MLLADARAFTSRNKVKPGDSMTIGPRIEKKKKKRKKKKKKKGKEKKRERSMYTYIFESLKKNENLHPPRKNRADPRRFCPEARLPRNRRNLSLLA